MTNPVGVFKGKAVWAAASPGDMGGGRVIPYQYFSRFYENS